MVGLFITFEPKYDETRLDFDMRLLRQFYLTRGYADIDVTRAQGGLLPDRSGFAVLFELEEGIRYKNGIVTVNSEIQGVDTDELAEMPLIVDDWYDVRFMEQGLLNITNRLGALGYSFVNVTPTITTNPETATIDVAINIGAARKNYIERIEIVNNNRAQWTRLLRRELQLVEGDAFNQLKLDNSIKDIRNLGYFSKFEVANFRGSTDTQTVTEISVEEQSTGDLQVSVSYSTIDKASFNFGINERNFLGWAIKADFSVGLADESTSIRLGLTEPYFLGRNMYARGGLFSDTRKESSYTSKSQGFDLGIGFDAAGDIYHIALAIYWRE